jgi:hypothetical protein
MRLLTLMTAFSLISVTSLTANELPTDVILRDDGALQTFKGSLSAGASKSFTFTALTSRAIKSAIDASNDNCGAEMRRSSERGFMPQFDRFPALRAEQAKAGETMTISFFQTRTARINGAACVFSLTIQ